MADRSYLAYTRPDALASAMDASTTSVVLVDGSTFPDPATPGIENYTVIVAYGTSREEVCTVTAKPTVNTLTVIRHEDGTLATPKNVGDVVVHGVSARDFTDTVRADDARLTDPRAPLPHAASHAPGASDPVPVPPHVASHAIGGTDALTPAAIGAATAADASNKVLKAGDTMTGTLNISQNTYPGLVLLKTGSVADSRRWKAHIAGPTGDTGASASALALLSQRDDGTDIAYVLVYRDGRVRLGADPTDALDAATKQYVDTVSKTVTVALTPQNGYINDSPALGLTYNLTTARITGEIKRTSGTSMTVLNAGAIPAIARPPTMVTGVLASANGTDLGPVFYGKVNTDGSLTLMSFTGQPTWSSATVIGVHFTWAL